MNSHHEDTINFGREEANRMHARDPWVDAEKWLRTTTGQEFCDELVWGSIGQNHEAVGSLLRTWGIIPNIDNRQKFLKIADKLILEGNA